MARDLAMRYISRVDNRDRGTHGWLVRVPQVRSKFVSDRIRGKRNRNGSLSEAKNIRNQLLRLHVAKIVGG